MADIFQLLKQMLTPQGTKPVVRMFLKPNSYFPVEFIDSCLAEVRRLPNRHMLGDKLNALEKLGMTVLLDSAYLNKEILEDMAEEETTDDSPASL